MFFEGYGLKTEPVFSYFKLLPLDISIQYIQHSSDHKNAEVIIIQYFRSRLIVQENITYSTSWPTYWTQRGRNLGYTLPTQPPMGQHLNWFPIVSYINFHTFSCIYFIIQRFQPGQPTDQNVAHTILYNIIVDDSKTGWQTSKISA